MKIIKIVCVSFFPSCMFQIKIYSYYHHCYCYYEMNKYTLIVFSHLKQTTMYTPQHSLKICTAKSLCARSDVGCKWLALILNRKPLASSISRGLECTWLYIKLYHIQNVAYVGWKCFGFNTNSNHLLQERENKINFLKKSVKHRESSIK